jgi:hypothetical protein
MITATIFSLPCHSIIAMWNDYNVLTFADVTDCELSGTEKQEVEYDSNKGIGLTRSQNNDYCIKASDYLQDKSTYPLHKFLQDLSKVYQFIPFTIADLDNLDYDKTDFLKAVVENLWKMSQSQFEDIRL